jgi:hypothetical protein
MADKSLYFGRLYPLQDEVLRLIRNEDTGFYLTGGTAASRGYLNHRFSDDLDLFVNDDRRFGLWTERLIYSLSRSLPWKVNVLLKEERFVRLELASHDIAMKMELVNDVPARLGEVIEHSTLGRLDSPENILANKITALIDRNEPKDLADIWGFCCRLQLSLIPAIEGAQSKAAGVFPADLARVLCSSTRVDWELIRWIEAPPVEQFLADLKRLGESLIL